MGIASPWFLFGLAALAVPLYLHLLRRVSTPRPFSSLLFFEPQTQSSQRHRRLRHWALLALRLALVLLIVAAFTNPFVTRHRTGPRAPRLVLLIIDRSFSMRAGTRLEEAKRAALAVLANVRAGDRVQVIAFSSQLQVLTSASRDIGAQRAAIEALTADDARGDLGEVANAVRQAADKAGTAPVEAHLISDFQQSNLPANAADMTLPDAATLVVHRVTTDTVPNWTLESVTSPDHVFGSGSGTTLSGVRAVVAGFATPEADRTVSLRVNGSLVSSQRVQVPAGGRATVEFTGAAVAHGFSRCEVTLDAADALREDDTFRFAVERSDPQPVLFIHTAADARSPLYFSNALAAAEGAAFALESVTLEQAARLSLNRYAFVVIAGIAALPASLEDAMQQYVQAGGKAWIVLGPGARHAPVPVFENAVLDGRDYGALPGAGTRFASVEADPAAQHGLYDPSLWSGVKFFYAARVEEGDSSVLLRLTDRTPLLLEKNRGEGQVLLMTSGFEGLSNDLPLHPAFVAFVAQTARHLSGRNPGGLQRVVDSFLDLHAGELRGAASAAGVEVIDPEGQRPLSLSEAASARSLRLEKAGYYQVRLASGRTQLIAVNPDRRESDLRLVPDDVVAAWQRHAAASAASADSGASAVIPATEQRVALWQLLVVLALAAALAQSWVGGRYLTARREEA